MGGSQTRKRFRSQWSSPGLRLGSDCDKDDHENDTYDYDKYDDDHDDHHYHHGYDDDGSDLSGVAQETIPCICGLEIYTQTSYCGETKSAKNLACGEK